MTRQTPASSMAARIAALREMSVADLREKYDEVFGEETRSRHKDFLWKRIAWRMQALEEGDLSERARRRSGKLSGPGRTRSRAGTTRGSRCRALC